MCGCKDYQTCHRKTIAEMLRADGFEVEEIGAGDAQPRREQAQFDLARDAQLPVTRIGRQWRISNTSNSRTRRV